ncbi:SpaA isopeptide-forming pilin-related protein [Anaerococcus sp. Marseille-P9784]|uniref:SpaA isopeptide-forming pilin-related protein n=1 Tax=Anaerococcus sp. Marseille-P9784 TaxID=2614127 RepID=UPI00124AA82A|nr:SpaA isopeptide-forming pilin-related protein [Anaerococcus sp. Marseille-P9784]
MKSKLKKVLVKILALVLVFTLTFPSQILAQSLTKNPRKIYGKETSLMGLKAVEDNQGDKSAQNQKESTFLKSDIKKEELEKLQIEKSVSLSQTTGQISYRIAIKAKENDLEKIKAFFAINKNSKEEKLKLEKTTTIDENGNEVEIENQVKTPNILNQDKYIETLSATTENKSQEVVYYLSTQIEEKTFEKIKENKDQIYSLDFVIKDQNEEILHQERLSFKEKEDKKENEENPEEIILEENPEDKYQLEIIEEENQIEASFKETNLLGDKKAEISWTDYLINTQTEAKESINYQINLDENQDTKESQIKVDFYQADEEGFILKKEFSQEIPFAKESELQIPQGFIAKIALTTTVKKDVNPKEFTYNNKVIKNPSYKEETTDKKSEEENKDSNEDPLPDENKEIKENSLPDQSKEQTPASPIDLNKDALINKFQSENKLNEDLKAKVEEITKNIKSYNDEKINEEEFKNNLKDQAKDLDKENLKEILATLTSGLNEEKFKVAKIDAEKLLDEIYPKEEIKVNTEENQTPQTKELIKENTEDKEKSEENSKKTNTASKNQTNQVAEVDEPAKEDSNKEGLLGKLETLLFGKENVPTPVGQSQLNLEGKKFTVRTVFKTSNIGGPIQDYQYFKIHLDDELTVKNPSELKDIVYNGRVIAKPTYNKDDNTITYNIEGTIPENIEVPLNIPVDYNTEKITLEEDGTFTVTNKVSGLGIKAPKDLVPQKIDKNGNPAGSIIEPDRDDVEQIIDQADYKLNLDPIGTPVVEDGEMTGMSWTIKVNADEDLKDGLGFNLNLTTVKGSGLGEIQKFKVNGQELKITSDGALKKNPIDGNLGITSSVHYKPDITGNEAIYTFYTPVVNRQGSYMVDISIYNAKKTLKKGAVRSINDNGFSQEAIRDFTPTRSGINNRTTILGEFKSNNKATWTITDAVSSKDENNGLPLEKRTLEGNQTITSGQSAVYGLNDQGKMVQIGTTKNINSLPTKESYPQGKQEVGTIAVYQLDTSLTNADQPNNYSISGVRISKFRDLYIDQVWNLPEQSMTMPGQDFIAKDNKGNELGKVHVDKGTAGETTRFVTIPNARYWDIDENSHEASKRENKIEQKFDQDTVGVNGKTYKYNENANYYQRDTKSQYIHNSAIDTTKPNPVTFTVVKVDSKDPSKKLAGARFKLLGDNQPSIVTDDQGKAAFNNVLPGTYTLTEEKAPAGYKLDQSQKTITIAKDGTISVDGGNIQLSGGKNVTKLVQHDSAPNWPDYMNAMHYGKITTNGTTNQNEVEFYLYLKPESNNGADGTNRNTRLNISIPGVNITDVKAYDVSPGYRNNVKYSMEQQNAEGYIPLLGENVINAANNNKITGTANTTDPYTGKTGYQIYFPQQRFENDWGFLVKVKANIGNKQSVSLDYDWLTDKDTAIQTNLTQSVILNKTNGQGDGEDNQILVTNEEFTKSPITATKFGDTFNAEGKRNRLGGAEFVLKDSNGKTISNKFTNNNGEVSFGQYPPGTYRLEEVQAPDGYQKSDVYFEVLVDEQGQVTYKARFEDGIGTPEAGRDFYIEQGEETDTSNKAPVTNVNQRLEYLENEPGDIGVITGVWEAYKYESLKYHADITLSNSAPGTRFEIQFDRNLDFTQYFSDFPKIVIGGEEVADPYFDYNTNLLTYVFNDKSKGGPATASINLRGIIPDKYYAKESKTYPFTIKVAPGVAGVGGNPILRKDINADYGPYDSGTNNSNQFYYFRDVYQKEDGNWYVTVMAYLNPMGFAYGSKTSQFNWITTDFQGNQQIARWSGKGYKPLYTLQDVKVYGTDFASYKEDGVWKNPYMPKSFGVRPEQDPNIYHLLAHQRINPDKKLYIRENDVTINYDPNQIKTNARIDLNHPLKVTTPGAKDKGGYIIEQTYKITDIDQFNKKWRAFHMTDGNLESAFASKANVNTAVGDQAGGEIPKYYKEVIGLINNKYKPGSFKLTKYDETNQENKLPKATFALKDENGKVIYRSSDANGVVNFESIAPGRYSLEETKAPDGYRLTNKKWQVTVLNDGSVRIRETSITGESNFYTNATVPINIPVPNKPVGQKFRVYKKDGKGQPLPGAKFKITDPDDPNFSAEATSGPKGIVEFEATLKEGKNYILQEVTPPTGYNPLNKKWVLRVEAGKTKVYNYSESTEIGDVEKSLLGEKGTEWVDVKNRNTSGWSDYDNRWTGWADKNLNAQHLGTRIIAINKKEKYVVQRYIINPEAKQTVGVDGITAATIHREKPEYPNMDWYKGDEEIKIFTLEAKEGGNTDGKVTGLISDLRLASYKVTEITNQVKKTPDNSHYGEPTRLKLGIPVTNKPIVVDVKVPYKDENGGVGTGMDWREANTTYWKSDYYERVSDIKTAGLVSGTGGTIVGSYVSEDSLDVTNDLKTYGFKIKKVKEDKTTAIPGAVFKLTGLGDSTEEREMTTGKDGMISFNDLKPGTYKLEESKPAPGYEKKTTTWTIRVASDGKVYIKDNSLNPDPNNPSFTVSTKEKSATNNLMRRLKMAGANTELEIGGNLVDTFNPLRAGNGWEQVDNASSTQPTKREDASDSDHGQLIDTKIIEIDKTNNRYKQVFIYKEGYAKKNRNIKFHRAYDNYNIRPIDVTTRVFQVPANTSVTNINKSSDIDSISGKTDISLKVKFTQDGNKKIQTTDINTRYPGTILIEVETNYIENLPIGLGSNYDFNTGSQSTRGHKCWLEKSYANEAGVPVVKTTVNHTITFDGNGGTWHMDPVTVEDGTLYELPGSSFIAPDGKEFDGWLVNGQKKNVGDKITVTSDLTIQAQWRNKAPEQATVSFSPGDGSGTMPDVKVNVGSNYQLPANGFTAPSGKEFKAWLVNGVEYQPGVSITVNADTTITALWKVKEPETYNVIVQNPQEGGTITADLTSAAAGTEIKLTVSPSENYEIESVTMNGQALTAGTDGKYSFTMPEGGATVSATFKKKEEGPSEDEKEIPENGFAQITNKQTGLDLKIYKKDRYDRKLEGAIFTIKKTDHNFETFDQTFGVKKGTSNAQGLVEFKDENGTIIKLPEGYYVIEETAAPLGYRKANAPWKVQVVEENGQLVAKYKGPEETPQSFIEKNENLDIKTANGVKYATKITHIDTESRTFIQRVYIDTRGKNGTVNVQIKPKHKREEIDRPGLPPVTIKEGVKTAYRSTYKITGLNGDPDQAKMIKILNDYDVSYPDVTVVNTARWRPFDWGFDEDQLNLKPGVYYIDIEGFYDTSIIDRNVTNEVAIDSNYNFTNKEGTASSAEPVLKNPYKLTEADIPDEDLGKIDIDIQFFDGAREFQQLKNSNGKIVYGVVKDENGKDEASYQDGVVTLRQWLEDNYGKEYADNWFATKLPGQKYVNQLSKIVKIGKKDVYQSGRIIPPVTPGQQGYKAPFSTISTSMDISSLYSSNSTNIVPQEGLDIENDAERYNITFSKHGKLTDTDSVEEITKRRLEGAVFKLEKKVREGIYEELEGSYVSSAFNGYFGFRGLEPGRYRLVEVQAPKNYKPINGPLLYFSVETVSIVSQRITDPRTGENINVNTVGFYFPGNDKAYKFEDLEMHDPVTNEVIKFMNAKNADLETTKIIDPTDSTKKTEVSLRELSIKFPGEIKDKQGKVIKDTYKLSEIQITPTSNGYISLEYDKANGVYQYIPEKSTKEEDGLLVDYVTSATAKNMGKIVNEKPGKGEITIKKIDQKGTEIKGTNQLPGAKFRITNKETGKTEDGTVGADGTLKFTGLNIGHYRLEEIESPSGYINNKQVWNFTVGGEDLDPYAKDAPIKRKDVSSSITLSESKLSVLNPSSKNKGLLSDNQEEMHPHLGEVFEFTNKYTIDSNLKINPGDYFVLKLSENMDLHGIMETNISNLDIIADGVGTIAKADYNRKEGTITYTFTDYANTYSLVEFSNKLKAYINLNKVPKAGQQNIERGVVGHKMITNSINVVYDSMTARELYKGTDGKTHEMTQNHLNLGSKIIKFNPDTGEFVHYYYVNRDRSNTPRSTFYYSSDQNIENLNIDYYYLDSNANLDELMPLSFGVNEDDSRLPKPVRIRSRSYLGAGQEESIGFTNGLNSNSSYIFKVTGRVVGEDKDGYVGHGMLQMVDYPTRYVTRWDKQYFFRNEATAKANLEIQAVNPENKIKFKKIDQDGNPLEGAIFQLFKKNNDGKWDGHGQPITTGKDGIVEYSKLPKGEYQLKETQEPKGYEKLEEAILEFEVDASGNIHRSKETNATTDPNKESVNVDESGSIPMPIVNKKLQKIQFVKVDASEKTTKLKGAEFEVWYKKNLEDNYSKDLLKLYEKTSGGKTERLVLKDGETAPKEYNPVDKFTTGEDGKIEFTFYENGYYALKEIKAPHGHIKPRDYVKEFAVADGKVKEKTFTDINIKKDESPTNTKDLKMTFIVNGDNKELTYYPGDESASSIIPIPKSHFELEAYNIGLNWRGTATNKRTPEVKIYFKKPNDKNWTEVDDEEVNKIKSGKDKILFSFHDLLKIIKDTKSTNPIKSNYSFKIELRAILDYTNTDDNGKLSTTTSITQTLKLPNGDDGADINQVRTINIETIEKPIEAGVYENIKINETNKQPEPIVIVNKKAVYPLTGGNGTLFYALCGFVVMLVGVLIYAFYQRNKKTLRLKA